MKFLVYFAALSLTFGCASVLQPRVNDDLGLNAAVLHGAVPPRQAAREVRHPR